MRSPRHITLLFLLIILSVASALHYPKYLAEERRKTALAAVFLGAEEPKPLGERMKSENCAIQGPLPDHACTPGAVFSDLTLERMCVSGYTKTVRDVSTALRRKVFQEYNIPYPQPFGSYEVDHLIPLAIGGNNDIANLFPEAAAPKPGFREKDLVEVYLRQEVCAGRISLPLAQRKIAEDWLAIYNNLSVDDIAALKAKYRSWSN